MKKWEFRVLMATLIIGAAAAITVAVHDAARHTGAFTQTKAAKSTYKQGSEEIIIRAAETAKTAQFESEAEHEQETEEKVSADMDGDVDQTSSETLAMDAEETRAEVETETQGAPSIDAIRISEYDPAMAENKWLPYRVGGHNLDREIGDFLLAELRSRDLEWWMPYALAQMFQESRLDPMAQNRNGLDKGILQYRVTYWDWSRGDIFDWRAQIRLYVEQTARRLASGCSIYETISRHNTSDYGAFNQEYVDQVMQWVEPEC